MSQIDAPTLRDLTAVLAGNVARLSPRAAGAPPDAPFEQRLAQALAPGVVALASRLAAALPDDYDLASVLARFLANPAVARALTHYGEPDAAQRLADAFLVAGGDPDRLRQRAVRYPRVRMQDRQNPAVDVIEVDRPNILRHIPDLRP